MRGVRGAGRAAGPTVTGGDLDHPPGVWMGMATKTSKKRPAPEEPQPTFDDGGRVEWPDYTGLGNPITLFSVQELKCAGTDCGPQMPSGKRSKRPHEHPFLGGHCGGWLDLASHKKCSVVYRTLNNTKTIWCECRCHQPAKPARKGRSKLPHHCKVGCKVGGK